MKTMIVYASKSGTTKTCAEMLAHEIDGVTTLIDIVSQEPDLSDYDTILIGGPIRYGRLHSAVKEFMHNHKSELLDKEIGLFICCGNEQQAEQHFTDNFPPELLAHALAHESFGGEIRLDALSFIERLVGKMAMKSLADGEAVSIHKDKIEHFAHAVMS